MRTFSSATEEVLRDWRDLTVKIRNTPGVVGTAPYVQGPVIVEFQTKRLAPMIRGIDPAEEEKVVPLKKFIKKGALDLEGESTVLGVELARKLQIGVGDKLTIYSPGNLGEILDGIKQLEKTKGAGRTAGDRQIAGSRLAEGADGHRHFRDRPLSARLGIPARSDLRRAGTLRAWRRLARHHGQDGRSLRRGPGEDGHRAVSEAAANTRKRGST